MILPLGNAENQGLRFVERLRNPFRRRTLKKCRFVHFIGFYGWKNLKRYEFCGS